MKKILGIGNALVDVLVHVGDTALLDDYQLDKGGMVMIDAEDKHNIHRRLAGMPQTRATGGSASNTIHGLAQLGAPTGFIGKIGRDEAGDFFSREMQRCGVTPHLIVSDLDTGIATTFITPDAERTFATCLGAAAALMPDEIQPALFDLYDCVHVEGYLIFNHDLILKVCRLAKEKGLRVSMDMASYNIINEHREFVEMLLRNYVDIIFANEEEARAFTGKDGVEALNVMSDYSSVAVVKTGASGSMLKTDGEITTIAPVEAVRRDTTGAGDIYASGFLYGLINNYTPREAGNLASYLSAKMIEHEGAKLPDGIWQSIKKKLK